jgi:hypothetical protein
VHLSIMSCHSSPVPNGSMYNRDTRIVQAEDACISPWGRGRGKWSHPFIHPSVTMEVMFTKREQIRRSTDS